MGFFVYSRISGRYVDATPTFYQIIAKYQGINISEAQGPKRVVQNIFFMVLHKNVKKTDRRSRLFMPPLLRVLSDIFTTNANIDHRYPPPPYAKNFRKDLNYCMRDPFY